MIIALFVLFCVAGASITIFPDTSTAFGREPFPQRIADSASILLLILGPVVFLLLDKRLFMKKFPLLKNTSFLKQLVVCAAIAMLGFVVIGVTGMIASLLA